jgi:hypothetical protein
MRLRRGLRSCNIFLLTRVCEHFKVIRSVIKGWSWEYGGARAGNALVAMVGVPTSCKSDFLLEIMAIAACRFFAAQCDVRCFFDKKTLHSGEKLRTVARVLTSIEGLF